LSNKKQIYIGIGLAILATLIWSGNFIVARGVIKQIPPVSLAFYRWLAASVLIFPLAWKQFQSEKLIAWKNRRYFFWLSLTGVAIFNTLVYIAGHYTSAINMALIGTTSSPIFVIILAALFLKERIYFLRIVGLAICITGIIFLLSQGSWERLMAFRFGKGDGWILLAALSFAIYSILVRSKPFFFSAVNFLFVTFSLGTLLLVPFFLLELNHTVPVKWDLELVGIILYLGLGASVISFLCWNAAIARLGAARTAIFGNLIPVFSSFEAVWILKESSYFIQVIFRIQVNKGLVIAKLSTPPVLHPTKNP
jgi:drug/metabolite transporter (DMT)-like permease